MIIKELSLTNFRSYETAHFTFKPGINIIAGVNGAGKSTALDAIRILMSRASREMLKTRESVVDFGLEDIKRMKLFSHLGINFDLGDETTKVDYLFEGQINFDTFVPSKVEGNVRDAGSVVDPGFQFVRPNPMSSPDGDLPLCIFFSAHRSLLTREASITPVKNAAFHQALGERRFNLKQAAEWWLAQEALSSEGERFSLRYWNIENAIWTFLPEEIGFVRPGYNDDGQPEILVKKGDDSFDLFSLSYGERGVIATCMEIARRLNLAYPDLEDPCEEGSACILIDEIELHLHPQWQREVLQWLETTFPRCQFIVTTHSPQVIGEVPHDRVWYVLPGGNPFQQDRSLGLDSSRVIEELMGGKARNIIFEDLISQISIHIIGEDFPLAREKIEGLKGILGENDPEVVRMESMLIFAEVANDPDSEGK